MRAVVAGDELTRAVRLTSTAVAARPNIPVLAGVLLDADDNSLRLSTFDFDTSARAWIDGRVDKPGRTLVSHRLLAHICTSVGNAPVSLDDTDGAVVVTAGRATWRLPVMRVEDYPTLPNPGEHFATLDADHFAGQVERVAAAAADEPKGTPPLDVVWVGIEDDHLVLASIDGYRLHSADVAAKATGEGFLLVPGRRLVGMTKHLRSGEVSLSRSEGLLTVEDERASLSTRLADGANGWNDWRKLLDSSAGGCVASCLIEAHDLRLALKQVTDFGDEAIKGARHVTLTFTAAGELTCAGGTDSDGSGEATVDTKHEGQGIRVVVNAPYLLDALATCYQPTIRLGFAGPKRPIVVRDGQDAPATSLVMPVGGAVQGAWLGGDE